MNNSEDLGHEIVLRPRFTMDLPMPYTKALALFEDAKQTVDNLVVNRIDHHVFIKIPKQKQHFWSPQLDLEILESENDTTLLKGLFGPKPAVWTLFMFAHFIAGTSFLGIGVWAYSNYTLDRNYALQLFGMGITLLVWFVLYASGRIGKSVGRREMVQQYLFMQQTLNI